MRILIETRVTHINTKAHSVFQMDRECENLLPEIRRNASSHSFSTSFFFFKGENANIAVNLDDTSRSAGCTDFYLATHLRGPVLGVHLLRFPISLFLSSKEQERPAGLFSSAPRVVQSPLAEECNFKLASTPGTSLGAELVLM